MAYQEENQSNNRLESVDCNLCGSASSRIHLAIWVNLAGQRDTICLVRCDRCGLRFLNPRPRASELLRFYPSSYYSYGELSETFQRRLRVAERVRRYIREKTLEEFWGKDISSEAGFFRSLWRKSLAELGKGRFGRAPRFVKIGRILNVGCGDGSFLYSLKKLGWDVYGIDISGEAVRSARMQGLENVIQGDFQTSYYNESFSDIVRMWSVLEYLPDPSSSVAKAFRILRPGGTLVVQVPNIESLASRLFGARWVGLDLPRHLYHFSRDTLSRLLGGHGFSVVECYYSSVGTLLASATPKSGLMLRGLSAVIDYFLDRFRAGDCIVIFGAKI